MLTVLLFFYTNKDEDVTKPGHFNDIIMSAMASQITGVSTVCSTVDSGEDKKEHQIFALGFVRGIHRSPVNSPHKGQFPFDDVIMWQLKVVYIFPNISMVWHSHVSDIFLGFSSIANDILVSVAIFCCFVRFMIATTPLRQHAISKNDTIWLPAFCHQLISEKGFQLLMPSKCLDLQKTYKYIPVIVVYHGHEKQSLCIVATSRILKTFLGWYEYLTAKIRSRK